MVRLINIVAVIAVIAIGVGAWLTNSEKGTAWLIGVVERRAQPALTIANVDGTLLGGLTLGGVRVSLPGRTLSADRVAMSFDPLSLLTGAIILTDLSVDHATYRQSADQADGPASSGTARSSLPVNVVVRRGRVGKLDVVTGTGTTEFATTEFSMSLVRGRLRVGRLSTNAQGFDVKGNGELSLAPPHQLSARISWSRSLDAQLWSGTVSVNGAPPRLSVHEALASPFELTADGTVRLEPEPSFDIDAKWSNLFVPGVTGIKSPQGKAHVAGRIGRFQFRGEGELNAGGRQGRFALDGRRDGGRVLIDSLSLDGKPGKIATTGGVNLDGTALSLNVRATDVDPSAFAAGWPGRLSGTGRVSGRLLPEPGLRLSGLDVSGRLRDVPVGLSGSLAYNAPDQWEFDPLSLQSGANALRLSGRFGKQLDIRMTANVPEAKQLSGRLSGSADVQMTVSGTPAKPRVKGTLTGRNLAFGDLRAGAVKLQGELGLAPDAPADVALAAEKLRAGTVEFAALNAKLMGTAAQHKLDLDARAEQWSAHSTARGGWVSGLWRGTLESFAIDQPAFGRWHLTAPAALEIGAGRLSIPRTCLVQADSSFCAALNLGGGSPDRLSANAKDFDLKVLRPLLPDGLSLQGVYQLSLNLTNLRAAPTGRLSLDGGRTVLRVALGGDSENAVETVIDSVGVDASLKDWRMRLDAKLSGRQAGDAHLTADVDDIRRDDSPVTGRLGVSWPDIGFAALLSPDLGEVGGSLNLDMQMGGALNDPAVHASAAWKNGVVTAPAWGFKVEDIEATATSVNGSSIEFDAKGNAGDGTLALRGTTELTAGSGWATRATLTGESVRAVQLPDAQIFVTPDLKIDAHLPNVAVTGTVTVPRAELSLDQLPAQAVSPSGDVVVHGVKRSAPMRPLHLNADLKISLGDKVHYTGANLDAMLSGDMRLRYRSGEPANASGAVSIDGKYSAYGQTLTIDQGRLVFNGPIDDPALDVRAVRKVNTQAASSQSATQTVGLQLSGTLQSPQSQIFSDPALSEQDALAYLLFGRSLANASQTDTAALQQAAITMGLRQALPIVQKIGHTLGIDELSVGPTEVGTGALMAGKYLSPNVYVRYSYGLFNRIGGLLLRFRINKRLSIETRSGEQKSMDLLYTVEKQ